MTRRATITRGSSPWPRGRGDWASECAELVDLGWLWTNRDYAEAGRCFDAALVLARALGDAATLAATLNRVGNWHLHAERPLEARRCHNEALALVRALGDRVAEATTLDLLGITGLAPAPTADTP
ncbi:MAG TPA: tetratricopeptide repeat protein [Thermomicrobiales bacterium]|nr:tetratricopeptide repeat protein [Thermomicrobiales bacterium]